MTTVILLPRTDLVNCFNEAFVKGEIVNFAAKTRIIQ